MESLSLTNTLIISLLLFLASCCILDFFILLGGHPCSSKILNRGSLGIYLLYCIVVIYINHVSNLFQLSSDLLHSGDIRVDYPFISCCTKSLEVNSLELIKERFSAFHDLLKSFFKISFEYQNFPWLGFFINVLGHDKESFHK